MQDLGSGHNLYLILYTYEALRNIHIYALKMGQLSEHFSGAAICARNKSVYEDMPAQAPTTVEGHTESGSSRPVGREVEHRARRDLLSASLLGTRITHAKSTLKWTRMETGPGG